MPADQDPAPAASPQGDHIHLQTVAGDDYEGYAVMEDGVPCSTIAPTGLFQAARKVRDMGYRILSVLSAYDRGDHFGVFYAFVKPANKPEQFAELRLRTLMPKKEGETEVEPVAPSMCDLFPAANWHEREMYDMYGIHFDGHPDLRRMFLPEGWTGYPMRKDYQEPEQFVALREGEDLVVKTQEEGSW